MAWDASKTGWIRQKTGGTLFDRPPGSFGPGANTASVMGAPAARGSIADTGVAPAGGSTSPGASSIMEWLQRLREMGRSGMMGQSQQGGGSGFMGQHQQGGGSGMMGQSQQGASGGASSIIEWLQRLQGLGGTARTGGIIGQDIPDTRPVWAGEGGPHIVPGPRGERPIGVGQELDGGYAGAPMPESMRDAWAKLIRIRR